MAEVAGLVLGGIPIVIWALEKYAEPFEVFHHYRISIETFRTHLVLQNHQLRTTLSNIGLGNEPKPEELRECFNTKFPDISRELMFTVQRMDDIAAGLMKSLDVDVDNKVKSQTRSLPFEGTARTKTELTYDYGISQLLCQIRSNGNGVE